MTQQEHSNLSIDLVEIIRGIVLILDPDGRIARCNPYFESLTGYAASEVIGKDWFDTFIPASDRDEIRDFFSVVMKEGLNDGYTNNILKKNGEACLIEWHSKTLDGEDGQIAGMLCTGFDVTERNAITLELERAKEEAVKATTTKSRFLAAASHDLRQPLQSLGLYLSALSLQGDEAKRDDIAEKMGQSLDTMGKLLDALLDISKLESGSVVAHKCDFHLKDVLDRVVTDNLQQAEEKGLKLARAGADCAVFSDPVLLERVIENLVTNAVRYSEQGKVTIDCVRKDKAVQIAVRDTGIGIPEDQIENVFEEYYQLNNQARDKQKGLGLGLSIVKHICRILDHPLAVSSVNGDGTTFTVEVPLGQKIEKAEPEKPDVSPRGNHEIVALFVDDDPAILNAITTLLNLVGIQMHSASSGDEALAHVEAGVRPDILISDYRLPDYNGVEVVRRVRSATVDDLPSVLLTGDTSMNEIEKANLDNCAVLHKPFDPDQLISLINRLTE